MSDPDPDSSVIQKLLLRGGKVLVALLALLALLLIIEIPLLITHTRHGYFGVDGWFAFFAVLGIIASVGLIFLGRLLDPILRWGSNEGETNDNEPLPEDIDERLR